MERLIPNVPFCSNDHYPCGLVALDAMLRFYGYTTPLILHDEWRFLYSNPGAHVPRIGARFTSHLQAAERWGIQVRQHQEADVATAWQRARAQIDSGRPVPVLADTCHLEDHYYPGLGSHSGHCIILAGYEDRGDTVHVVDPSPSKRYRGSLPLAGLKQAWASEHIRPCTWAEIRLDAPRRTPAPVQMIRALQQNLCLMRQGNALSAGIPMGLRGLDAFAADLTRWKGLPPGVSRNLLKALFGQLRSVVMERDGHSQYLHWAAGALEIPKLIQVSRQLHAMAQKWLVFRNLCLKGSKKAPQETLEKLHKRLSEITALEDATLRRLAAIPDLR